MSQFNVQSDGDTLHIDDNRVKFPNTIGDVLVFDELVVVRLKLTGDSYPGIKQNVIAVEPDGTIRWKIEMAPKNGNPQAYAGISSDEGDLIAHNLSGMSYEVRLEDGGVKEGEITK